MKFHKGKTVFNFKDTFSMNDTLAKVISAGLLKYKEVINSKDGHKGVPASIITELIDKGLVEYQKDYTLSDEDFEICSKHFDYVLEEMIYAFADNEPDIMSYDFKHTFVEDSVQDSIGVSGSFECSGEDEKQRYTEDFKKHNERCEEGRILFAKHFDSLWW